MVVGHTLRLRVNVGATGTWGEWERRVRQIDGTPIRQEMRGTVLYLDFGHQKDRKTVQARLRELAGHRNFLVQESW